MKTQEVEHFHRILEKHREEARRSLVRIEGERRDAVADYPQDVGDRAVVNFAKEFLFQQSAQMRHLLRKVEAALQRVRQGTFGVCAQCGNEISNKRLEAMPWTEYCRECQESLEPPRKGPALGHCSTSLFTPARPGSKHPDVLERQT